SSRLILGFGGAFFGSDCAASSSARSVRASATSTMTTPARADVERKRAGRRSGGTVHRRATSRQLRRRQVSSGESCGKPANSVNRRRIGQDSRSRKKLRARLE